MLKCIIITTVQQLLKLYLDILKKICLKLMVFEVNITYIK